MKYNRIAFLLFLTAVVLFSGCKEQQEADNKPVKEADRENMVSFAEDMKTELPENIYKFYAEEADIQEADILPVLIANYESVKKQVRQEDGPEGADFTLTVNGISYKWTVDQNVVIFQRLSEASGEMPEQQEVLESCNQILENMGFQDVSDPEIVIRKDDGAEYYDIKYKFVYEGMKILWDLPFESPYDPQAEVGITGERLEISYDAQGIKEFYVYGLRSVGEKKEKVASEELISIDRAVELFEEYRTAFQKNFGSDADSEVTGNYVLEQAELIYIPIPDPETKRELMIPAWYLKMNGEERYQDGQEENTIKADKEVLVDAVTGYVYRAE